MPGVAGRALGVEAACRATVLIPLHNHAEWIGPLLHSLFAQWRPDLALLVIDDASTDGSFVAAMSALEARPDIPATVLRNETPRHHGVADQAMRLSSSPVFIKADSDDLALPGRLDTLLAGFDADLSCRLVTTNAAVLNAGGMPTGLYDVDEPDQVVDDPARWASTRGSTLWLGATMAFHRTLITDFPPVDAELCPYGLDIVLAFRATLLGTHRHVARPLVGWRQHGRNTHRAAGVLDPRPAARENYAAVESMAFAQRLRDAKYARSRAAEPGRLDVVVDRCADTFFERHENWCRLRAQLSASGADVAPPGRVPPVPPIVSLGPGLHLFGLAGGLGTAAAGWHGVYDPEESWNWMSRSALIVLRTLPSVNRLSLILAVQPWLEWQRVFVSVNFGPRVETSLAWPGQTWVEVPVPGRWAADCIVLLVEAPDARPVRDIVPESSDPRRLGLMLRALELGCSGATGSGTTVSGHEVSATPATAAPPAPRRVQRRSS